MWLQGVLVQESTRDEHNLVETVTMYLLVPLYPKNYSQEVEWLLVCAGVNLYFVAHH